MVFKINEGRSFRGSRIANDSKALHIALLNNMPDAALEDTEVQFTELLHAASGNLPIRLSFYSLPEVPRGERAQQHISGLYHGIDELWNSSIDALIVTGTEPRQSDLTQEPYWRTLTQIFDWAERNTVSTVLSCLAAHAGVLYSDGIRREPLADKLFGVFQSEGAAHPLTRNATQPPRFPHSRWNNVCRHTLAASGYSILAESAEGGADLFMKRKRKSLFVYFQGHPEYSAQTLFKEYRRDVRRFLRHERESYPNLPCRYFDAPSTQLLKNFRAAAIANRTEEQMSAFPSNLAFGLAENAWDRTARTIYANWLQYIASLRQEEAVLQTATRSAGIQPVAAAPELS